MRDEGNESHGLGANDSSLFGSEPSDWTPGGTGEDTAHISTCVLVKGMSSWESVATAQTSHVNFLVLSIAQGTQ